MKVARLAAVAILALTTLVVAPRIASASDSGNVMAAINNAVSSFNKGDGQTWKSLCMPSTYIISNIGAGPLSRTVADYTSGGLTPPFILYG